MSLASLDFAAKKKQTKCDVLLAEMAAVVPWGALKALIEPHYPKLGHAEDVAAFGFHDWKVARAWASWRRASG